MWLGATLLLLSYSAADELSYRYLYDDAESVTSWRESGPTCGFYYDGADARRAARSYSC